MGKPVKMVDMIKIVARMKLAMLDIFLFIKPPSVQFFCYSL